MGPMNPRLHLTMHEERAPHWSQEQAERALEAAEGDLDEWGDLRAQTQALAEQAEERLKARERASGDTW
ncbi:MAG: hypothetical protein ACXVHQ_39600 [Solirubrobacteraceae bacterium]